MKKYQKCITFFILIFSFSMIGRVAEMSAGQKPVIINLGDQVSRQNPHYHANKYFSDLVSQKTNGNIVVKIFMDSLLGSAQECLEGLRSGSIEMAKTAAAPLSSLSLKFRLFNLPYVFTDKEDVFAALDGEIGDILRQDLENQGLKLIAFYDTGFRSVFNCKRPIKIIEDIKDLRIRVMNHPIMIETFNSLGAKAIPLAYGELYAALQNGIVDGAEQPPSALYAMKFYEVSNYLSLTKHFYDLNVLLMSKKFFDNALTPNQQKIVIEAGKATQAYERMLWQEHEDSAIKKIEATGMKVNSIELSAFKQSVKEIIKKYRQEIGVEFVDLALSYSR